MSEDNKSNNSEKSENKNSDSNQERGNNKRNNNNRSRNRNNRNRNRNGQNRNSQNSNGESKRENKNNNEGQPNKRGDESGGENKRNNNRRRNNRNNKNSSRGNRGGQRQNNNRDGNEQGRSNNRGRNSRGRRRNNKRRPNNIKLDPLFRDYEKLQEELIDARRKYYDQFHTTNERYKNKIENNYFVAIKKLREFETDLSLEDREKFETMYPKKPTDHTYSENHQLDPKDSQQVEADKIEDPHLLESQKMADYKSDEEESVGTIEDYLAYKGTGQVLREQNIDKILKRPINTLES